ncbi:MAG: redoxin domain-containing protein [Verrucomicrobia bacterium]|nr:redoxin domain-containing protein [Verrucomicrobiota bacterium]
MRMIKSFTVAVLSMILGGLGQAQPTVVGIDRNAGLSRITVQGEANRDYTILASDLSPTNWNFLATLTLTNSSQSWFDSASATMPGRFYRAMKLDTPVIPEFADDFRLIDHQGVSRALYYFENDSTVKAVVLIFTGNGCTNVQQMISSIKSLRAQFTPQGVVFWMVDANSADNRSNIVVEANAQGIDLPILHDRAQLVANALHATTTPEAVAIDKVGWVVFYRGAIDDRIGGSTNVTTQYYLKNALTDFLAGRTVSPRATQPKGCAITLNSIPTPSYSTDIAPLLQSKCVRCHSVGNFAPFPMTNYDIVQFEAQQMRVEVLAGRMPPWHADPYYQSFTNDISLTTNEAAMLVKWVDDGAPRGGGPDPLTSAPPPPDYPFDWPTSLGTPDIIIPVGNQMITNSGTIPYRTVNYTVNLGSNIWLRAAVVRPGTVPVVHHILAYQKGVDNTLYSFLTGYAPGSYLGAFPAGTGKLLTNGTALQFQLHYTPTPAYPIGLVTNDNSYLGLYTMAAPPTYPLIQSSAPGLFSVPPNTTDYQAVTESSAFGTNVRLYEFSPHLHSRGLRFKYEAIYPGGHVPASEVLLSVPFYVFHWQTAYRLAQPKDLPAGTKIRCTAGWDNSVQNKELMELFTDPDNPNNFQYDPNRTVGWGDQTWDEMFIGYFNYVVLP